MLKRYVFEREDRPGAAWAARFAAGREAAVRWYQGEGRSAPGSAEECRTALKRHMPELLSHYDAACTMVGDDDLAHRVLSHWRPPPLATGCTQAVWHGPEGPAIVRNQDFPLDMITERFELTTWSGRRVLAKGQRPWGGCLDGMNEEGLAACINFGGSAAQGEGFSIILMLRYVLETCRRVGEAAAALSRIPVALSQNVVLLDRTGDFATVFLGPDRTPAMTRERVCTNHQDIPASLARADWSRTLERQKAALAALEEPGMTLAELTARFLSAPLYSRRAGFTTAYTAVYRPAELRVDYVWPGHTVTQHIDRFEPLEYTHDFGELVG